jgi:hypothetical protein
MNGRWSWIELSVGYWRSKPRCNVRAATLRGLWRARCAWRRTPGSGGGPEKPTSGNTGRALRADLTVVSDDVEGVG